MRQPVKPDGTTLISSLPRNVAAVEVADEVPEPVQVAGAAQEEAVQPLQEHPRPPRQVHRPEAALHPQGAGEVLVAAVVAQPRLLRPLKNFSGQSRTYFM